jgi:hypothetical protein
VKLNGSSEREDVGDGDRRTSCTPAIFTGVVPRRLRRRSLDDDSGVTEPWRDQPPPPPTRGPNISAAELPLLRFS